VNPLDLEEFELLTSLAAPKLGDGLAGLLGLRSGSVSLLLSDLPSGETQADFDVPPSLPSLWNAAWHALKSDGIAVLMASNLRFAAALLASEPKTYRYDLVWSKSIATGFLNAAHRPLRAHEFALVFFREPGTYLPQMADGHEPIQKNGKRGGPLGMNYGAHNPERAGASRAGATDRFPRSILEFSSLGVRHPFRTHPQQKPDDLLRWIVRTYSRPGELVADPFAGSGSTGRAARAEGRAFIGWDLDTRFGR
jgi:site-specific DNA-methyltransferase (adenine-specific)